MIHIEKFMAGAWYTFRVPGNSEGPSVEKINFQARSSFAQHKKPNPLTDVVFV